MNANCCLFNEVVVLKLFNSLTRKVEEFKSIEKGSVKIYVCGPTVYDYIHLGNARPIVIFDCFRRYLQYLGYSVKYVQNFTDVDDKLIKRAKKENTTVELLADKYIEEYKKDAQGLLVDLPTVSPRVTENIDFIVCFIEKLLKNNQAYVSNGNVFFDTSSFKDYGKLSDMPLCDLKQDEYVEAANFKKSPLDFVLWKAQKEGEPAWEAPFGKGRPGWHIECSAMAIKFLGKEIDIHCGGRDLIFPHHENEIAQSESFTGCKFSNFWLHNGHVNVDGQKMSKSLGNFLTVRELSQKYGYEVLRYLIVEAHYNMPINLTKDVITKCQSSLKRIYNFKKNLDFAIKNSKEGVSGYDGSLKDKADVYRKRFFAALDEDFNTAVGVSVLFELIREFNDAVIGKIKLSKEMLKYIQQTFFEITDILKIAQGAEDEYPKEVLKLLDMRNIARAEKKYELADKLRDQIESFGYYVEETRFGSRLVKK